MICATLPWPPQANHYYTIARGRKVLGTQGRAYRERVLWEGRAKKWPTFEGRLQVEITASVPDARRRDLDNLLKPLLDALTFAGLWLDDSQIDHLSIKRFPKVKGGAVTVWVREINSPDAALRAIGVIG